MAKRQAAGDDDELVFVDPVGLDHAKRAAQATDACTAMVDNWVGWGAVGPKRPAGTPAQAFEEIARAMCAAKTRIAASRAALLAAAAVVDTAEKELDQARTVLQAVHMWRTVLAPDMPTPADAPRDLDRAILNWDAAPPAGVVRVNVAVKVRSLRLDESAPVFGRGTFAMLDRSGTTMPVRIDSAAVGFVSPRYMIPAGCSVAGDAAARTRAFCHTRNPLASGAVYLTRNLFMLRVAPAKFEADPSPVWRALLHCGAYGLQALRALWVCVPEIPGDTEAVDGVAAFAFKTD